jgi:hypothetical protein
MKDYRLQGTFVFPVSMIVKGGSEIEAIQKAIELLNSYNIMSDSLNLQTCNGIVHTVKVHDVEVEWESVEEVDCKEEIKKEPLKGC